MSAVLPGFAAFAATLDSDYALDLGSAGEIAWALVAATPYPGEGGAVDEAGDPRSFSLLFRGPREPRLDQGIVPLRHPRLGRLDLFVVPVVCEADGMRYEAVFG